MKLKKLLQEFEKFAIKGNMMDMAVGVIIGGAFGTIVNSVVNDLIMPVVSLFTGKLDFSNMFIALDGKSYPTLAAANEATATFNYGSFITQLINFLIIAFVVFMMVKAINKLTEKHEPEEPAVSETRKCPRCLSEIPLAADRCAFCTSDVTPVIAEELVSIEAAAAKDA